MMKMAIGDDSPLRQGAGMGLDWFSVATEPCGGGTSDLGYPEGFRNIWEFIVQRGGAGGH